MDAFRANVARECVKEHSVAIINDVSGLDGDTAMLETVAELNVPYVLTHSKGVAGDTPHYDDFIPEVFKQLADKMWSLRQCGVKDIILDPGFGFAKSAEQNFELLAHLSQLCALGYPVLAGLSRKSMIYNTLGVTAAEALAGTVALNWEALRQGATILRVHDVREAVDVVQLYKKISCR